MDDFFNNVEGAQLPGPKYDFFPRDQRFILA
jgi:hypothetical protein